MVLRNNGGGAVILHKRPAARPDASGGWRRTVNWCETLRKRTPGMFTIEQAALIERWGDISTDELRRRLRCRCGAGATITVSWDNRQCLSLKINQA